MSRNEPYIWLFSDDDMMEPECVEAFYQTLNDTHCNFQLYHFDVKKVDESGKIISVPKGYDKVVGSFRYYKEKLIGSYMSLVVENIFSRDVYKKYDGFKNFDMAWGSDTATWAIFCEGKGMYTIPGPYVLWRSSSENITPDFSSAIVARKVIALNEFFRWSVGFFQAYGLQCLYVNTRAFVNRMSKFQYSLTKQEVDKAVGDFCQTHHVDLFFPLIKYLIKLKG